MFGLVLAGGGVRGAYHMGVWKALRETDTEISAISGSSIGAINGALVAQGSFETALEMWERISLSDIVSLPGELKSETDLFDLKNIAKLARLARRGENITMEPLERLLHRVIDEDAVRSSPVSFGLTAYSLTEKRLVTLYKEDIPKGKLIPYLMASASLPGFKPRGIDGEKFIDGSVGNTMPVDMIMRRGIDDIITVNVRGVGFYRDFNTSGRNIIPIEWKHAALGTMEFDGAAIKRCIREGYLDTLRTFGRLWGSECYFDIAEYESVKSRYGDGIINGIQHAAKAFGVDCLRVAAFDELVKEVTDIYASELRRETKPELPALDDKGLILGLAAALSSEGFGFAKSKLDILGKNYGAASALVYFKRKTEGV